MLSQQPLVPYLLVPVFFVWDVVSQIEQQRDLQKIRRTFEDMYGSVDLIDALLLSLILILGMVGITGVGRTTDTVFFVLLLML